MQTFFLYYHSSAVFPFLCYIIYCVLVWMGHSVYVDVRGQLARVGCYLLPCGSRDQSQFIRLDDRYLNLLSHLTSSCSFPYCSFTTFSLRKRDPVPFSLTNCMIGLSRLSSTSEISPEFQMNTSYSLHHIMFVDICHSSYNCGGMI